MRGPSLSYHSSKCLLMLTQDCGDILAPYGIVRGANSLHPPRDLRMKMNICDQACMARSFTYAANFVHRRVGDPKYSMASSRHRVAATRVIKERVKHPSPYLGDNTMLAVIGSVATVCETGSTIPLRNKNTKRYCTYKACGRW